MTYLDKISENSKQKSADKYKELKEFITSKKPNGDFNEFFLAHEHMIKLELENSELREQVNEYKDFFDTLKKLLPKDSSIHDRLI